MRSAVPGLPALLLPGLLSSSKLLLRPLVTPEDDGLEAVPPGATELLATPSNGISRNDPPSFGGVTDPGGGNGSLKNEGWRPEGVGGVRARDGGVGAREGGVAPREGGVAPRVGGVVPREGGGVVPREGGVDP